MNSTIKISLLWIVIITLVFLFWSLFRTTAGTSEVIPFSTFLDRVSQGTVERVVIRGSSVRGVMRPNPAGLKRDFQTIVPANYPPMYDLMRAKGVVIELELAREAPFLAALITWAPILLLISVWIFFVRRMSQPR